MKASKIKQLQNQSKYNDAFSNLSNNMAANDPFGQNHRSRKNYRNPIPFSNQKLRVGEETQTTKFYNPDDKSDL
jgi:hypothetical protein